MRTQPLLTVVLLVLVGPSARLAAQSVFVYAASDRGLTSANAYPLDDLADDQSAFVDGTWKDLFVQGQDRWLIRGDGKVNKNGTAVADLVDDDNWLGLVVDDGGTFFALREGGRVAGPAGVVVDYTGGDFGYLDILTDGLDVYVLRSNGAVFRVPETDPVIHFDGPPGEIDGAEADGEALDTTWVRLALDPTDGRLWALRGDGTVLSAAIPDVPPKAPEPGTAEAALPYDNSDDLIDFDELYQDLGFDTDGTWYALRADGRLFDPVALGPPLVDFPSGPSDGVTYVAVLARAGTTVVLRDDGKVFRDVDTTAVVDLKQDGYFGLGFGTELPNLDTVKNQAPSGTSMTITAPEGSNIELPVLATDRDKPSDQLVVEVDEKTLPAGATWDGKTRVLSWPLAGPAGTYKITVTVDDGIAKPVKAVQTIKIQTPDENPDKNVNPVLAKVKRATALVGLPFALPLPAFDRDGDLVLVSLDDGNQPLPAGATFDRLSSTLLWDAPVVADKGSTTFHFLVDDGTVVKKQGRKVKVETSLLGF